MDTIENLYQYYIESLRNCLWISENVALQEIVHRIYSSLNGNVYLNLILPFLVFISCFLLVLIVVTSALFALCCFFFFLPIFLTVFAMSLLTAYHFTLSIGVHIMEAFL